MGSQQETRRRKESRQGTCSPSCLFLWSPWAAASLNQRPQHLKVALFAQYSLSSSTCSLRCISQTQGWQHSKMLLCLLWFSYALLICQWAVPLLTFPWIILIQACPLLSTGTLAWTLSSDFSSGLTQLDFSSFKVSLHLIYVKCLPQSSIHGSCLRMLVYDYYLLWIPWESGSYFCLTLIHFHSPCHLCFTGLNSVPSKFILLRTSEYDHIY